MDRLDGRCAVVTGAASGIGLAIARRCAAEGMKVVLADVEAGPLEAATAGLQGSGAEALGVVTDVADPDQVDRLARSAADAFGDVHLLVNNAGVGGSGLPWELSLTDWHWVMGVCFWGVVHGLRSFVPAMIAHGQEGHVVNTSSWMGLGAAPNRAAYETSKSAVTALTEGLFFDLADAAPHLGVSLLCPGYTATAIRTARRNHPVTPDASAPAQAGPPGDDPSTVADLVIGAVRQRRFYVLAQPEVWLPSVRRRLEAIMAGADPAPLVAEPGTRP
jgi:NAD(P)-dependent dehydrogenase (short-subunit alcohol dehydrogenase family)